MTASDSVLLLLFIEFVEHLLLCILWSLYVYKCCFTEFLNPCAIDLISFLAIFQRRNRLGVYFTIIKG